MSAKAGSGAGYTFACPRRLAAAPRRTRPLLFGSRPCPNTGLPQLRTRSQFRLLMPLCIIRLWKQLNMPTPTFQSTPRACEHPNQLPEPRT